MLHGGDKWDSSPGKSPRWEQLGDVQLQKFAYLIACIIID